MPSSDATEMTITIIIVLGGILLSAETMLLSVSPFCFLVDDGNNVTGCGSETK